MDITLAEAWALWWSGQQLTEHSIHGMSVLWAARTGKLMAFLAGTTIVLDIIGSKRLVAWGEQLQVSGSKWLNYAVLVGLTIALLLAPLVYLRLNPAMETLEALGVVSGALSVFVSVLVLLIASAYASQKTPAFLIWFGGLLAKPRFERWLRTIAVPLFFLGFGLDYLAS